MSHLSRVRSLPSCLVGAVSLSPKCVVVALSPQLIWGLTPPSEWIHDTLLGVFSGGRRSIREREKAGAPSFIHSLDKHLLLIWHVLGTDVTKVFSSFIKQGEMISKFPLHSDYSLVILPPNYCFF